MNVKDWKIPYTRPRVSRSLAGTGLSPLLCQILALRGINSADKAKELLDSSINSLTDPLLMRDMKKARDRVLLAIKRHETVAVYGDYDVDGITSTCLLTDYLRYRGLTCHSYIPDRNEEGYGLNISAIDKLHDMGVSLIITVDCGITAVEEAKHAAEIGVDMVITDHHECRPDALPKVKALVDYKREGDRYPNKYLAGVGVALKLVCACEGSREKMVERYADLAAIGTVADVMPLIGENRYLVRKGLGKLSSSPRPGISAMYAEASIDARHVSAGVIGYAIAPRLNAAGRLGKASLAAELIQSQSKAEAAELAKELCELNRRRQSIELEIWEEANKLIEGSVPDGPIVLASESWHQGVIGIAASRLAEQYSLPAIIICLNGDVGKGSCRSFGGFNLFEALSACSGDLIGFGGHALAAGLNIRRDKLDDFRRSIAEYFKNNRPDTLPSVCCDLLITDPSLLTVESVRSLELLEPFGNANPKPTMCLNGVRVSSLTDVGGGRHLRIRVRFSSSNFECIYFSHNIAESGLHEGDVIDIAFTPQINDYRGNVYVQLVASAVRLHDAASLCHAILTEQPDYEWAAAAYCPERADFIRVWRYLIAGHVLGNTTAEIIEQCPRGMEPERFCLCLMVFKETGLIKSDSGSIYAAHCCKIYGKADLESTRLIRALRSNR